MLKKSFHRGFTLIELMVTIAIATILLMLGVPSLINIVEGNAVSGHVSSFTSSLSLARSEAIKRGVPVVMCRSTNAETSATPTCSGGTGWEAGWIVFVDRNANNNFNVANSDVLLRVQGAITNSGGIEQNSAATVVFRPTGLASSGASQFTFNSKSLTGSRQRRVCLSISGRTRVINNSTDICG